MRLAATIALYAGLTASASAAPALWQVSDSDSSVYLFGSIHALPPDTDWRTPLFEETLKSAETIYFEADIGPLGQIALGFKMASLMADAAQHPWLENLTPEQRDKLTKGLEGSGYTVDQMGAMPPWMAMTVISAIPMTEAGFVPTSGVDYVLQGELPKEQKAYFETAAQQLDILADSSVDEQLKMLFDTLDSLEESKVLLGQLSDAWLAGTPEAIAETMAEDPSMANAEVADKLLYNRNANWIPVIEGLLAENHNDLIIVGAAHLSGDRSVVDLLTKAGFTVRRIQ